MNTSKPKSPFNKFYLTNIDGCSRLTNLKSSESKVFNIMLDNLQSDNYCKLSAQGITDKCGVSQPTVSRAINGLEAQCLIYRINRTIIVDPNYCWRGDVASHYKAMQAHSEHVPYYSDVMSRLGYLPF
jgi:predicted transcriptional regulator